MNLFCDGIPPRPSLPDMAFSLTVHSFTAENPTEQATVMMMDDLFNLANGIILYYAILVAARKLMEPPLSGCWDSSTWPPLPLWSPSANGTPMYQASPAWWSPFVEGGPREGVFTLGVAPKPCKGYCNHALQPATEYALKIRAFTATGFQDTELIFFVTANDPLTALSISVVAAIFCIAIVLYGVIRFRREIFDYLRNLRKMEVKKSSSSVLPISRSKTSFVKHYFEMVDSAGRFNSEYQLLGTLTTDVNTHAMHGLRNDNRKKNRYFNILPFDITRVELTIVDDDPATDYINASFIRGFLNEMDYIACQGPLPDTCHDFWRMVFEQNVHLIVMLADLVELDVVRCHKYYPDLGETVTFDDIQVTCTASQDLGPEILKRTLSVTRKSSVISVYHIHYTGWPDKNVPADTQPILTLCDAIGYGNLTGCTVIHCSAGIGRTGTLLAVHILLQTARQSEKLNVLTTVLELRQQRTNMVANDIQYQFIYRCIVEYLLKSKPRLSKDRSIDFNVK